MGLSDDLLIAALSGLKTDIGVLQASQEATKTELHAAIVVNTAKTVALEAKMTALDTSVNSFKLNVRKEVRSEARRWGFVGGAFSSATAIIVGLLKAVFRIPHVG